MSASAPSPPPKKIPALAPTSRLNKDRLDVAHCALLPPFNFQLAPPLLVSPK
jgi:hypothetical protein